MAHKKSVTELNHYKESSISIFTGITLLIIKHPLHLISGYQPAI